MGKIIKYLPILAIIIIGIIGFIKALYFLDPDFGWHIREGELILKNGIQTVDPFSYTMPSFAYIDHEWLSNVFMYLSNKYLNIAFLPLIYSVFFALSIFIIIPSKYKKFSLIPILLSGSLMLAVVGVRPQVETWVFFALILRLIFDEVLWQKFKTVVPIIFIFWANLHGGFSYGIIVLFTLFIIKSIEAKKIALGELKIFSLSFLATGVNPYGFYIWQEIWRTASDSSLRFKINEWTPSILTLDISFIVMVALSLAFIISFKDKFKFIEIAVFLISLLMAFSSLRNISIWAIVALYILSKGIYYFNNKISLNKNSVIRFNKVKIIAVIFFVLLFLHTTYYKLTNIYSINAYPVKAVEFLKNQDLKANIFTDYDYGGYLIWKIPQKKVYIDGRMPSWKRSGNFANESNNAFLDYEKMLKDEAFFKNQLVKYDIEFVLLNMESKEKLSLNKKDNSYSWNLMREDLTRLGLKKVYDDKKFVIYRR